MHCTVACRFVFRDYAPHTFFLLRKLAGVSNNEYLSALRSTTREKFSEGSSGAFLYFSKNEKFIVKTMSKRECQVLLAMLPEYTAHFRRHPNSLLTRFFGCHSITIYGTTMFFVVMDNVLWTSQKTAIHERYDLKGSWVNRHRQPLEKGQWTECR